MKKIEFSRDRVWTIYFVSLLLLSFYYLSYRYPLKYNSSDTSFSYSDTPVLFQVGKYIIFAGISYLLCLLLLSFKEKVVIKRFNWLSLFVVFYVFFLSVSTFVISRNDYLLQSGIFFSALLVFYIFPFEDINYKKIIKCIRVFIYVSIIVEMYQLFNYYVNDRLPALGYPNSTSVRFGSIWDDPNAFAMIVPFLVIFVLYDDMSKFKKFILILCMFISLLYTLSFTGVGAFILAFPTGYFILFMLDNKREYLNKLFKLFLLAIIGGLVYKFLIEPSAFFVDYLHNKQASIQARKIGFEYFNNIPAMLGFNTNPIGKYSETAYINMLLNYGIFYLVVYVSICLNTIYRLALILKKFRGSKYIQLYYAAFFFVVTFMIGMLNSPLDTVFPLNLILIVCIILSYTKSLPILDVHQKPKKNKRKFKKIVW